MTAKQNLRASWNIPSGDVEDDIINSMGKQIQQEIDFEILSSMLTEIGWKRVVAKPMTWEDGMEIDKWVDDNCQGKYETCGLVWMFEKESDANWFSMRWLG